MKNEEQVTIGVDVGGTNTVLGVVCTNGEILSQRSFPTQNCTSAIDFVRKLSEEIDRLDKNLPTGLSLCGIGIAAPTANYFRGTIAGPANLRWGEFDLVKKMQQCYGLHIAITNDANAAALGEMKYGAAQGMKNFIEITLGTGLGSGIVVNGKVLYGEDGLAGEFGHIIVKPEGRQCGCGRFGCLETYVSASGLCRTVLELLAHRLDQSELRMLRPDELTARRIYEFAEKNDPIAIAAFEQTGRILGRMLANTLAVMSPEAIILFGGLANAGELLLAPTRESFERDSLNIYKSNVKLLLSALQHNQAGILGASVLVMNEIEARRNNSPRKKTVKS